MSFWNGLLMGLGQGLTQGGQTYFEGLERQKQREREDVAIADRRSEMVRQGMLDQDRFAEQKRSNRRQEDLEHERNVQSSLDRMLASENARAARDQASQRAIEVALINAARARDVNAADNASREKVAGMPARTRPPGTGGTAANPDGMTQTQRDGIMLLNRQWQPNESGERQELERLYRQAREAFPNANPGDVAMAAKRMYDRMQQERQNRY